METGDPKRKEKTLKECIESLETLFKSYKKDSEFNYQLEVENSEFNILKKHFLIEEGCDEYSLPMPKIENQNFKRYIKTADGKVFDMEKIKKAIIDETYYNNYHDWELKREFKDTLSLYYKATGTENALSDQVGRECNFGVTLNCDSDVYEESDSLEELCDEFILIAPYRFRNPKTSTELEKDFNEMVSFYTCKDDYIYGAIWTKEGLKYIAKTNEEGELEVL